MADNKNNRSVYLSATAQKLADYAAEKENRSFSNVIEMLILRHLAKSK